jgi:hypothetical protein
MVYLKFQIVYMQEREKLRDLKREKKVSREGKIKRKSMCREISGGGSTTSKEAPTSGDEGRHRRKGDHDQRCYV